jgi:hypothetical protein
MVILSRKLSKNFAIELSLFYFIRKLSDGLNVYEFQITGDWYKADHKPSFKASLTILNFVLFDLSIYNVNHVPDDPEDMAAIKYREMLAKLMDIRKKHNGEESPEEDLLLEQMDKIWWKMSESDRQCI